jgi:sterol desaturase/sphingolipid hydroxylase (fatty acid hydroxylase superfamily)
MRHVARLFVVFLILAVSFGVLEKLWPAVRGQKVIRKGWWTDMAYWLLTPLVSKQLGVMAVGLMAALVAVAFGIPPRREIILTWVQTRWIASTWPIALQVLGVLVVGDFFGYWAHRWMHSRRLWPVHAVHHASEELDWLSSVRLHPLNSIWTSLFHAFPLLLLGFDPRVVGAYIPFLPLYAIFLHANISWEFGPLKYLIATPHFHRWHHTAQDEGLDKNFAGLFPFWDRLFGTLYLPEGKQPSRFGAPGSGVPESFWKQIVFPFRRALQSGEPSAREPDRLP